MEFHGEGKWEVGLDAKGGGIRRVRRRKMGVRIGAFKRRYVLIVSQETTYNNKEVLCEGDLVHVI